MATVTGDIAGFEAPLGEKKKKDRSNIMKKGSDLKTFADEIQKINAERTARYHKLVGRPEEKSYTAPVRRVAPKQATD